MDYFLNILKMKVDEATPDTGTITLSNGLTITVAKGPMLNGHQWAWKVGDQYFSKDRYAEDYLKRLITEKLTGKRILLRSRGEAPDICGIEGCACRSPGQCNTALCSNCPVADDFFAARDGVELVYAI